VSVDLLYKSKAYSKLSAFIFCLVYGFLLLLASIAEIVIGWLKIDDCSVQPSLPYLLLLNGVCNIIQVHMRNLAHQRRLDYFLLTFMRIVDLFTFLICK